MLPKEDKRDTWSREIQKCYGGLKNMLDNMCSLLESENTHMYTLYTQ